MGVYSRLINNTIKQSRIVVCQILEQDLSHITLAVAVPKKKYRIRILDGLNQEMQIVKIKWSFLTREIPLPSIMETLMGRPEAKGFKGEVLST
jgi:hypothetical protein